MGDIRKLSSTEQYAFRLVVDGATSTIEDDLDEDGFFASEDEFYESINTAFAIVDWLRDNKFSLMTYVQAARDSAREED
jgi:hypothetical protein